MNSVNRSKVGTPRRGVRTPQRGVPTIGKHTRKRPFVVATFAITADGKVTTKNFGPVDFTSREDKLHLFRQRASADAVLIGHTSLERDNVRLGLPRDLQELRIKRGESRSPMRVIISNKGRIDARLKIFQSDISPIIVFSTKRMPQRNQKTLQTKATLHLTDAEHVDLALMLETLRNQYKVGRLACEGGPTLFRALLEKDLIDQLNLTIAPHIFGGSTAPTLTGLNDKFLPASIHCSLIDVRTVENECFLIYRIKHPRAGRN
jgi:riboflavin-specific deaminase-like protein